MARMTARPTVTPTRSSNRPRSPLRTNHLTRFRPFESSPRSIGRKVEQDAVFHYQRLSSPHLSHEDLRSSASWIYADRSVGRAGIDGDDRDDSDYFIANRRSCLATSDPRRGKRG